MLPKSQRLNLKSEKNRSVFIGKKYSSESFSANFDFKGEGEYSLINVVVSKKQFKLAVDRNRSKRLIWSSLPVEMAGIEKLRLILRPKKTIFNTDLESRKQEMIELLKKISEHGVKGE